MAACTHDVEVIENNYAAARVVGANANGQLVCKHGQKSAPYDMGPINGRVTISNMNIGSSIPSSRAW